jgi:hypothetical protein
MRRRAAAGRRGWLDLLIGADDGFFCFFDRRFIDHNAPG